MDVQQHMTAEEQKLALRAKRTANLRPAKKGEIRNPNGRGVGKDILRWVSKLPAPALSTEALRVKLRLHRGKIDVQTAVLLRLAFEACCGDLQAIQLWLDRKYGEVTQPLDVGAKTGPLVAILNTPQGDQQVIVKPPPPPANSGYGEIPTERLFLDFSHSSGQN